MEILLWVLIAALFILSFVGIIFPIIPSVVVLWGGFGIYYFGISKEELSLFFWLTMIGLTVLLFLADIIANSYFVKKYGGTKWGERVAAIATILGSFIYPPFGLLLVPFIAVLVVEWIQHKDIKKASKVGIASIVGFLSSSFAKVVIQIVMIIFFILDIII